MRSKEEIEGADNTGKEIAAENDLGGEKINIDLRDSQFGKKHWYTSTCDWFRTIFHIISAIFALGNSILDILYAYTTIYIIEMIFFITCGVILLKVVVTIFIGQCYYSQQVRNFKPGMKMGDERKLGD